MDGRAEEVLAGSVSLHRSGSNGGNGGGSSNGDDDVATATVMRMTTNASVIHLADPPCLSQQKCVTPLFSFIQAPNRMHNILSPSHIYVSSKFSNFPPPKSIKLL